jgi:hypothetical protein
MNAKGLIAIALLALGISVPVSAGLYVPTYTETAILIDREVNEIIEANGLSPADGRYAKLVAATWFFIWPCNGSGKDIPKADVLGATQEIALASPKNSAGAAMMELAFLLIRQSDGRGANPDACRYAKDTVLAETR